MQIRRFCSTEYDAALRLYAACGAEFGADNCVFIDRLCAVGTRDDSASPLAISRAAQRWRARNPKIAECEECAGLEVEELIVHGDAAAEIVRVAKERDVDLILISSHGRTGLGRILFGSTAEAVVRHASCPVLVVKPPQEEEAAN